MTKLPQGAVCNKIQCSNILSLTLTTHNKLFYMYTFDAPTVNFAHITCTSQGTPIYCQGLGTLTFTPKNVSV